MGKRFAIVCLWLAVIGGLPSHAQEIAPGQSFAGDGVVDWIARTLSPAIRRADKRIDELSAQLQELPRPGRSGPPPKIGFHSPSLLEPDDPQWVQVDLGEVREIDSIALVPVGAEMPLYPGRGYGFPVRFKVEISAKRNFTDPVTVADHTEEDFSNPGDFPVVFHLESSQARFVRVTSTRHFPFLDHYVWALGELMVLSGNYNIAFGKNVQSSGTANYPSTWSTQNLTDGQSVIGAPEVPEQSPSNGWLGEPTSSRVETKWIETDLGEPMLIDEVRLIPARPTDIADTPGMGFPALFRFSVGIENGGEVVLFNTEDRFFPNPLGNPVIFPIPDEPIRFIRVTADRLWSRGRMKNFALAEIQAYSEGRNVALGASVNASDSVSDPQFPRWEPQFAADGFSSQYRLIELPDYLKQLDLRHRIEQEITELRSQRDRRAERVVLSAAVTAGVFTFAAIAALSLALLRQVQNRKRESLRLREQIAHDLHDDIGSNLGSIALTSQMADSLQNLPPQAREDFAEIHEVAESTAESMRDIVWLIDTGDTMLHDLASKMRDAANRLLANIDHTFTTRPDPLRDRDLALYFRRHFFFAFKETLNNVRKHAGASHVAISLVLEGNQLTFQVTDNGCGFDPEKIARPGHGLANYGKRATRLNGSYEVDSEPGRGTTITFSAPFN